MADQQNNIGPFALKDCSLVAIATGEKAQNLREMRDRLINIHPGSIYYHFWGGLLRSRFDDPQFNNEFAVWSHYALHDDILAERLAVIDPTDFLDLESLRQELLEVIEQRLEEIERPIWVQADLQFHFIRSEIVVFDTGVLIDDAPGLAEFVPKMALGSIFYHFIDARRRTPAGLDDFRSWLGCLEETHEELCHALAAVDPYFTTLSELRTELDGVFGQFFRRSA
ncbi:DUF5752 family protein [Desulfomonile tiedjei]|uniref:Uncharacterized protein n=1 Tax=Desulfomonile tiedjei (strain ATCC 49306 / DSM 6799 / DCB-1) TaxID=706587 RepID=I4C3C3_DESTA|nr:DUF5752 family protein [Desulfomonile tiedjei]AFM24064.1 hypothetical protein Desti_1351 [Desulfomonile tiedjei DSM 6799]